MGADDLRPGLSREAAINISRARSAAADAAEHLRIWRHGPDDTYQAAGPQAIARITDAINHLRAARDELAEKIEEAATLAADKVSTVDGAA